jgi:hypothetical protein
VTVHPRVAAALRDGDVDAVAPVDDYTGKLPSSPEVVNSESLVEWLEQVVELMDPQSARRKELRSILERQRFRELRDQS